MSDVTFDHDKYEEWFQEDLARLFERVLTEVVDVLDSVDEQVTVLETAGFDEGYVERSARDIKATAFDTLAVKLADLVL